MPSLLIWLVSAFPINPSAIPNPETARHEATMIQCLLEALGLLSKTPQKQTKSQDMLRELHCALGHSHLSEARQRRGENSVWQNLPGWHVGWARSCRLETVPLNLRMDS